MAGDCSAKGWRYVFWNTPGMQLFTIITFLMLLLGIILAAAGNAQQRCPSGYDQCTCTDTNYNTHECGTNNCPGTGTNYCADKECPNYSTCSAGYSMISIASFIIFIQLCRLCCCAGTYYYQQPVVAQQPVVLATVMNPQGQYVTPQAVPMGQPYGAQPMYAQQPYMVQPGMQQPGTYAYPPQGVKQDPPMAQAYPYPGQGYTMESAGNPTPSYAMAQQQQPMTTGQPMQMQQQPMGQTAPPAPYTGDFRPQGTM